LLRALTGIKPSRDRNHRAKLSASGAIIWRSHFTRASQSGCKCHLMGLYTKYYPPFQSGGTEQSDDVPIKSGPVLPSVGKEDIGFSYNVGAEGAIVPHL
jgi:hypothetical protein